MALFNERLVYARRTFPKSSVILSTRDATFFDKLPSHLRKTRTLGGKAEPSPAKPGRAEQIRARANSHQKHRNIILYSLIPQDCDLFCLRDRPMSNIHTNLSISNITSH